MGILQQLQQQKDLESDARLGRDLKQQARDNMIAQSAITQDRYLNDPNVPLTAVRQQGGRNMQEQQDNGYNMPQNASMGGQQDQLMSPPNGQQDQQLMQQVDMVLNQIEKNPDQAEQILQQVQGNPQLFQAVMTEIQNMQLEMQNGGQQGDNTLLEPPNTAR